MDTLDEFQQNHRVIEDFVLRALVGIRADFGRLAYVAALWDPVTERYGHEELASFYSEPAVHQALRLCHLELFERILEMPLERQEAYLRLCLEEYEGEASGAAARWAGQELYRRLAPREAPDYLQELFCSNVRLLLRLIATKDFTPAPTA